MYTLRGGEGSVDLVHGLLVCGLIGELKPPDGRTATPHQQPHLLLCHLTLTPPNHPHHVSGIGREGVSNTPDTQTQTESARCPQNKTAPCTITIKHCPCLWTTPPCLAVDIENAVKECGLLLNGPSAQEDEPCEPLLRHPRTTQIAKSGCVGGMMEVVSL